MGRIRSGIAIGAAALALGLAACGGGDDPEVGDCIDSDDQVVACDSSEATYELTSDQEADDAIACIVIDDPPEEEIEVGDGTFCAKPLQ